MNFVEKHSISDNDIEFIAQHEKTIEDIIYNYDKIVSSIENSTTYIDLHRALTEEDVIFLTEDELNEQNKCFKLDDSPSKFIPASGAASRMFGYLENFYTDLSTSCVISDKIIKTIEGLDSRKSGPKFAFVGELRDVLKNNGFNLNDLIDEFLNGNCESARIIIKYLLYEDGLNYCRLPKAFIPFHVINGVSTIPLKEHMDCVLKNNEKRLLLTVSPFHYELFIDEVNKIKSMYRNLMSVEVVISKQEYGTDSIAIYPEKKEIVRDNNGDICFFPAGHGSLIKNIKELTFIKNIDNISNKESVQRLSDKYHKAMVVILYDVKTIMREIIHSINKDDMTQDKLDVLLNSLVEKKVDLFLDKEKYRRSNFEQKKELIVNTLNRPICINGLVRNNGEPGGGPFFYKIDNVLTSSIVEKDEISSAQKNLMKKGCFFNPVDILIDPTDIEGNLFQDLTKYEDSNRILVVKKVFNGREIIRVEHPGLWNGRMAKYNKIWIVVPNETFAPVKELIDLLNNNHQGNSKL
jgi:hypothetical protein